MFRAQKKFLSWDDLPDLEIDEKSFVETWTKGDVLFGPGCEGKAVSGVMRYIQLAWTAIPNADFVKGTYKGFFGDFVGFPSPKFLEGSGTRYDEYDTPYQPNLVKTNRQNSFKEQLEVSRYSPIKQRCTGSVKEEALHRVSKSSKAFLEYCLFVPHIKKIHFVLDDLDFERVIRERFEEEAQSIWRYSCTSFKSATKIDKGNSHTSHEIRFLHRLALLYPQQVQKKVICWYEGKKSQLPAKSRAPYKRWNRATGSWEIVELRDLWKCYEPKLEKCQRDPMYPQIVRDNISAENSKDSSSKIIDSSRRCGSSRL